MKIQVAIIQTSVQGSTINPRIPGIPGISGIGTGIRDSFSKFGIEDSFLKSRIRDLSLFHEYWICDQDPFSGISRICLNFPGFPESGEKGNLGSGLVLKFWDLGLIKESEI